jgi:hypothetical protein
LTQFGEDGISSARDLVMQFVENMGAPFMVVGKARRQPSWMKSETEDIDRRLEERWIDAAEERSLRRRWRRRGSSGDRRRTRGRDDER